MPKIRPDEQRKIASVKRRFAKCKETPELTALIQEYNTEMVTNVAMKLLNEGVYQSTLQAKLRFPQLFEISPAQSAKREASEAEAAKNEAESINSVLGEDEVQHTVEAKITATRKEYAFKKTELDRMESATIAEIILEDSEYQRLVGERLERDIDLAGVENGSTVQASTDTVRGISSSNFNPRYVLASLNKALLALFGFDGFLRSMGRVGGGASDTLLADEILALLFHQYYRSRMTAMGIEDAIDSYASSIGDGLSEHQGQMDDLREASEILDDAYSVEIGDAVYELADDAAQ
ncbi:hypothetical protein B0A48_18552 [Cryoendolithus antarcticus]|uniref:Uncharacterized protein n=1 Tax=Cryoendolithus antarcticus TaxID=1507870 RepID=A0A1V8S871_9PEZI|nr:hypothetical protein B0A48_18552 [Cryoendolithus antarcticus]